MQQDLGTSGVGSLVAIRCGCHQGPLRCRFLGRHSSRLSDAERCLASEKRSSGKSRGWFWADQRGLWGFDGVCSFGFRWEGCLMGVCVLSFSKVLSDLPMIGVVSQSFRQSLYHRFLDLRRPAGPCAVWRAAEVEINDLWRTVVMRRRSTRTVALWVVVVVRTSQR